MIAQLSDEQICAIQSATEELLETVGLRVQHAGLRRRASKAGARVDDASGIIRIAAPLLRELLAQAPAAYSIAGLDGIERTLGGDNQHCLAIVTDPWITDYETQRPRKPRLEDLRRHTIIAQRLDDVTAVSRMDYPVADVAGPTSSLRALEEHLLHHAKHNLVLPTTAESFHQWLEIGDILADGAGVAKSKLMSVGVAVLSPLVISELNGELLLGACANECPVVPTVCPMAGTTAPYNTAGMLLQTNVEAVGLAALTQMVRPGQPCIYHVGPSLTDMRSGGDLYYMLDKVLWKTATVQLGRAYNLPTGTECGGSMTYRYDQQNGAEGMLFMLAAFRSGANLLAGIGSCYNAVGMSAEMMVIQIAWLQAARHLGRGIDTELLPASLESIRRAGPGGNFLADELTLELLRSGEFFHSEMFDLSGQPDGKSMLERAHERVESLTAGFKSPAAERVQQALRDYFERQHRRLR